MGVTVYLAPGGRIIVGGKVVTGGKRLEAVLRAFWIRSWSMITIAAIDSTIGTARGTTQGSWRPRAARVPGVPSYWAVCCACEIVAGDLNPILGEMQIRLVLCRRRLRTESKCPRSWWCHPEHLHSSWSLYQVYHHHGRRTDHCACFLGLRSHGSQNQSRMPWLQGLRALRDSTWLQTYRRRARRDRRVHCGSHKWQYHRWNLEHLLLQWYAKADWAPREGFKSDSSTYLSHTISCFWMRTPCRMFVDLFTGDGRDEFEKLRGDSIITVLILGGCSDVGQMNFSYRRDESDDLDTKHLLEVFFGDSTGGNAT